MAKVNELKESDLEVQRNKMGDCVYYRIRQKDNKKVEIEIGEIAGSPQYFSCSIDGGITNIIEMDNICSNVKDLPDIKEFFEGNFDSGMRTTKTKDANYIDYKDVIFRLFDSSYSYLVGKKILV